MLQLEKFEKQYVKDLVKIIRLSGCVHLINEASRPASASSGVNVVAFIALPPFCFHCEYNNTLRKFCQEDF